MPRKPYQLRSESNYNACTGYHHQNLSCRLTLRTFTVIYKHSAPYIHCMGVILVA